MSAFANCSNLKSISIPNSVKSIGDFAFQNCEKLTSITLTNSALLIGYGAFSNCTSLTEVNIMGNPMILEDAFKNTPVENDFKDGYYLD